MFREIVWRQGGVSRTVKLNGESMKREIEQRRKEVLVKSTDF